MGPNEISSEPRVAALQRWRAAKPHTRAVALAPSDEGRIVDRDAFAQLELDSIVARLAC